MRTNPIAYPDVGRVTVCTTATRPTGTRRYEGKVIWDTDVDALLVYTGGSWTSLNGPRGYMGYAQLTTSIISGITTLTDLTSLSVTWTAAAGRRYKVTFKVLVYSSVANDDVNVWLRNGSSTKLNAYGARAVSTSHGIAVTGSHVLSGLSAGSQTVKLSMERVAGSGNIYVAAGSTYPAFILVEDIG